jgi:hypothetical protein
MLLSLRRRCGATLLFVVALVGAPFLLHAQSVLIPVTQRRDIVFDHAGKYLYISTSNGLVRRYNLITRQLEGSFVLGGSLNGLDIAPDDSFIIVAQDQTSGSQGTFHKVSLVNGALTNINYALTAGEGGGFDVAIGANGRALVTTIGSGFRPLRQIDLATNAVNIRNDLKYSEAGRAPGTVAGGSRIFRSADGTRLYVSQPGYVFFYNSASDSFTTVVEGLPNPYGAALNRDGTRLASGVYGASLDTVPGLHYLRSFFDINAGVVFDSSRDILYGLSSVVGQVIAYDSKTYEEKFRLNIGEQIPPYASSNPLISSPDGRYLALATDQGVRLFSVADATPSQSPAPRIQDSRHLVFDHSGRYLYATTATGFVLRYNLATKTIDRFFSLGGFLWGADISADDSFLMVAQRGTGVTEACLQKLNLVSGAVTNIGYKFNYGEAGSYSVSIDSNGRAMFSTSHHGTGFEYLRQIDLGTNIVTDRKDGPMVSEDTEIRRSADGTRLYISQQLDSSFTYSAKTDSFGKTVGIASNYVNRPAAVSGDGEFVLTQAGGGASLNTAPDLHLVHIFPADIDGTLAFSPFADVAYGIDRLASQIVAFDLKTFAEKYRISVQGDIMDAPGGPFNPGDLFASPDGKHLALSTNDGFEVFDLASGPTEPPVIPRFENTSDFVFDHQGKYLYVTTLDGDVWPYNISTRSLESPYRIGGRLRGTDIASDDSFLLAAEAISGLAEGTVHKLNLTTRAVKEIAFRQGSEGCEDVKIASNGLAFVTTRFGGSGFTPLRQIDLATLQVTTRTDAPNSGELYSYSYEGPKIERNGDATRLYIREPNITVGERFSYSASTNTFGPVNQPGYFLDNARAAVNRTGTLFATRPLGHDGAFTESAPGFNFVHNFIDIDNGIAFDALKDILYGVNTSTSKIVGYDTATFAQRVQFDIGEPFDLYPGTNNLGQLRASPNGRYLAVQTPTNIRLLDLATGATNPIFIPTEIKNISTRSMVQTGDNVSIAGFIISGPDAKPVILRALGPSLAAFGVTNAIPDPTLELHDGTGRIIASNDNWADPKYREILATGYGPHDYHEAVILTTLNPGAYTVVMRGKNSTTGIGLVEVYDLRPTSNSKLSNISTRSFVGTDNNVMIGGVIASAQPTASQKILIRALGPSLTQFGVSSALQDPILELHNAQGTTIASNDNWKSSQQGSIQATGVAPGDDRESAILANLVNGNYTAIVRGKNRTSGTGLVEFYTLP